MTNHNEYRGILYRWRETFKCYCLDVLVNGREYGDFREKTKELYWFRANKEKFANRLFLGKTHDEARETIDRCVYEMGIEKEAGKYNI